MYWKRILKLWQELVWWEKEIFLWFGYLTLGRRAILPAMTMQAGCMAVIVWLTPSNPVLWCLAFIVSSVYALMFQAVIKR